jgi:PAS domain S-box-containing protein
VSISSTVRSRTERLLARREVPNELQHELLALQAELEEQAEELRIAQRGSAELAAHYRLLFFDAPLALLVLDEERRIVESNQRAESLLGATNLASRGRFEHFVASEDAERWRQLWTDPGRSRSDELKVRRVGGERRLCEVTISRRSATSVLVSLHDLTEQRRAEDLIRVQEQRSARLLRDTADGVLFVDALSGRILETNSALANLLQESSEVLRNRSVTSVFPEEDATRQELLIRQAIHLERKQVALALVRSDGTRLDVEATVGELRDGAVRTWTMLVRDMSARRQLEAERAELIKKELEGQKLQAVGQLAAGVAHDMNNVLAAVIASVDAARNSGQHETETILGEVRAVALRGRELTGRLAALFRKQPLRQRHFDMSVLLKELEVLLSRTLPQSIRVACSAPKACWVDGDEGAWHQALLNLALNARDAMPDGGELKIECETTNSVVELVVHDTGVGMTPAVRAHAFEPFFTTKAATGGTGLGLAHVRGVANAHDAELECESRSGEGTTFRFRLPAAVPLDISPEASAVSGVRLRGRVLFVDDEDTLRRAVTLLLRRTGVVVTTASSVEEALACLERDTFDVILTDLQMPAADGESLAQECQRRWPNTPVVVCTGDVQDERLQRLLSLGVRSVFAKPFTLEELTRALAPFLEANQRS